MLKFLKTAGASLFIAAWLTGCGGGGGGDSTASVAPTTFPARAALRSNINAGSTDNFTVSGTCSGTATIVSGAAQSAVFEGVSGYAASQASTLNLTNCTPATTRTSGQSYYDLNYTPLGSDVPNIEYTRYASATPPPLPETLVVGDAAVYAQQTAYSDSTKTTPIGTRVTSYAVTADTATTAILNLVTQAYDTNGRLVLTQQSRYRIGTDASLSVLTLDIQYNDANMIHLVYTKV